MWSHGDIGWVVAWEGGPHAERVRLSEAPGGAFDCRPCDEAGRVLPHPYPWTRWPAEVYRTRGEAEERCR